MSQTKREVYERQREKIRERADAGEVAEQDAEAILEWTAAYDDENALVTTNGNGDDDRWGDSREPTTLKRWCVTATMWALEVDGSLLDASADQLNRAAQRFYDGTADGLSDRKQGVGLSKNTVRTRQNSLKRFLEYHANVAEAEPGELHIFDSDSTLVDPSDMLTQEEFHALRNAPEHPRDRAIVNLFLYTGQRSHAIRTLRLKDVDVDDGTYRLNTSVDGLKGADRVATWNPLLGATGAIRDWLSHHPDPGVPKGEPENPDAYLLCERRDYIKRDPESTISGDTVNRVLRQAAKKAAEEHPAIANKPTHAHAMRHNFVTMCKVQYDMDNDTIKRLIRHKPDSTVMETTYAHLSDEDYIAKAEQAFGIRDESDEEFTSPEVCGVCNEPLSPGALACENCGTVFSPDAADSKQKLTSELQDKRDASEDLDMVKVLDKLERLQEDPEFLRWVESV